MVNPQIMVLSPSYIGKVGAISGEFQKPRNALLAHGFLSTKQEDNQRTGRAMAFQTIPEKRIVELAKSTPDNKFFLASVNDFMVKFYNHYDLGNLQESKAKYELLSIYYLRFGDVVGSGYGKDPDRCLGTLEFNFRKNFRDKFPDATIPTPVQEDVAVLEAVAFSSPQQWTF
jgi:hypothetical protein